MGYVDTALQYVNEAYAAIYPHLTLTNLFFVTLFVAGFSLFPLVAYFRLAPGQKARTMVLRILWTVGAMSMPTGRYALDQRDSGRYECNPVRPAPESATHDSPWEIYRDGWWVELDEAPDSWSRLGMRAFAITGEKTENRLYSVKADVEEYVESVREDESPPLPKTDEESWTIVSDGGREVVLTGEVRGGYPEAINLEQLADKADWFQVSMSKVDTEMQGAGSSELAFNAGEESFKDNGGNRNFSNTVLSLVILAALVLGVPMGMLVMGAF